MRNIEFRLLDSDGTASAVLEARRSLASDLSLHQHPLVGISRELGCIQAVVGSVGCFCDKFVRSDSSYSQECALNVRDVYFRLLQQIYGERRFPAPGKLAQPTAYMADELTPSQLLELDKTLLKGLLLKSGSTTSHTMTLARLFNIPTLVDVGIGSLMPWLR